jgi:hypothetical protein
VGILDPEHISPDDLTARLRANGVLPTGRVTAVHPGERRPTLVSMIIPLRLEYSADAPPDAPTRTILKTDRAGLDPSLPGIGEREVMFYRRAAPVMPGALLARCFDAEYSDGRFHILLEDLSETHTILTQWPLPPSDEACAQIIDAWAVVHAVWWRHPQLGHDIGTFLDDAAIAKTAADVRARYARFADALGDRLWPRAHGSTSARSRATSSCTRRPASIRRTRSSTVMHTSGTCSIRATASERASGSSTGTAGALAARRPISRT